MLNWKKIDTVLLDMDGTLLDLNFDNHFWLEFVPQRYADKNNYSLAQAKQILQPLFKSMEGKLEWYCLDYWSEKLQLDIAALKVEISSLICVLPHVIEFLEKLQQAPQRVLLVTNAHRDSLGLKMDKTCLQSFFDGIICSHDFGAPKETQKFWQYLQELESLDINRTLLVDDSLSVLRSAQLFGIKYCVAIRKPDSQQICREINEFTAIKDFRAFF